MKKCFKCGEEKRLNYFYKHPMMKDGHLNKCKECTKKDVKIDRKSSPNARNYDNARYKNNEDRRKKIAERAKKWREKHPDRYKAHTAVSNAVRDGRLVKLPCEVCGEKYVHAHHDNYKNPLEVKWLCPIHHQELHHSE